MSPQHHPEAGVGPSGHGAVPRDALHQRRHGHVPTEALPVGVWHPGLKRRGDSCLAGVGVGSAVAVVVVVVVAASSWPPGSRAPAFVTCAGVDVGHYSAQGVTTT